MLTGLKHTVSKARFAHSRMKFLDYIHMAEASFSAYFFGFSKRQNSIF